MPEKIFTADSLVFIGLRLDRTPTLMLDEKYTKRIIEKLYKQKEEDKKFEPDYLKAIDKIKRRIRELERFSTENVEDYRADFIKMLSTNLDRVLCSYESKDSQNMPKGILLVN